MLDITHYYKRSANHYIRNVVISVFLYVEPLYFYTSPVPTFSEIVYLNTVQENHGEYNYFFANHCYVYMDYN